MKTLIVYNSKTGFTARYANWIAEEINCTVLPYKNLTDAAINESDIIIFGSRVHAGRMEYLNGFKSRLGSHPGKIIVIFASGAAPAAAGNIITEFWKANLTPEESESIPHFYFQSGLNYESMGFFDRMIMKAAAFFIDKKKNKTHDEAEFEKAIKNSYDVSSKDYIQPLVHCIREKLK